MPTVAGESVGSPGRLTAHGIGYEDPRAEQTDRPHSDQQRSPGRALPWPKRAPQAGSQGQRQKACDNKVSGLCPARVTALPARS